MPEELHLAVALDGTGWHPAAWREPDARPDEVFGAPYWIGLAREAEAGTLDFLTIEDSLTVQSSDPFTPDDGRTDQVRGRLDAVLLASRIAPATSRIGLVPATITTHTEPFHTSTALATLDYVSEGRAGWRPRASASRAEAAHFGRRDFPALTRENYNTPEFARFATERMDEAADAVEAVRRLWDSWEDDAVIRDVATGRFVDRDKLHYIDFEGEWFNVRGPSITPRPPQGQPVVTALAHRAEPYLFAARSADIVFITPFGTDDLVTRTAEVRAAERQAGRPGIPDGPDHLSRPLSVYADLIVFLDDAPGAAAARKRRLDTAGGAEFASDCDIFSGTAGELADLLLGWRDTAGLAGFRLRPGALPHDLRQITQALVPELRRRGVFRTEYAEATLRERLGLPRPASRYVRTAA